MEIKLQVELEEKRKKALNLQKVPRRGRVLFKSLTIAHDRAGPLSADMVAPAAPARWSEHLLDQTLRFRLRGWPRVRVRTPRLVGFWGALGIEVPSRSPVASPGHWDELTKALAPRRAPLWLLGALHIALNGCPVSGHRSACRALAEAAVLREAGGGYGRSDGPHSVDEEIEVER